MKEITDIVAAYKIAKHAGKSCALATVVLVEGSSYRRPGARMLVTDDGMLTGAISGGCLEGDALRKALHAISEGKNKLVTYDTTDEDDAKFGVQLGCNGIVHILFEPLLNDGAVNSLMFLGEMMEKRSPAIVGTFFSLKNREPQRGTVFFMSDSELNPGGIESDVTDDAREALRNKQSVFKTYQEGTCTAFLQYIPPPLSLIIAGAGNDAMPLTAMANLLGWETTVIDGRKTHATASRFPLAKKIIVAKAEEATERIEMDESTAFVLMTHNYNYDLALLKNLSGKHVKYIGVLGPKSKMERMLDDLAKDAIFLENDANVFSPVGLDIGSETSEEIALSIAAEIKAVMMEKNGKNLKYKGLPIHD